MAQSPEEIIASISCTDCVNALSHCYTSSHQFDRIYKDGKPDNCQRQKDELMLCWKLKAAPPEEAKVLLKKLLEGKKSPTEGIIWQPRTIPPPDGAS